MTQTVAIFHEAYRSLNAKKMFWLVLILSGLVVGAFAFVGVNEKGLNVFFWQIDHELLNSNHLSPSLLYKWIYVQIGIGVWLSWIAAILALVSTAGIFPDLITSGSIDLLVSKPIGRLRLFVTEYVAGLLFVTLQVGIFSLAGFLVIGLRGGVWEPGLFMAVPLVVCFFSYLFAVCVFLGVATRSTLASLLLTLLFWFVVWGLGAAENTLLMFKTMDEQGVTFEEMQDRPAPGQDAEQEQVEPASEPAENDGQEEESQGETKEDEEPSSPETEDKQEGSRALEVAHKIVYGFKTVLPKTTETVGLVERTLIDLAELPREAGNENQKQAQVGRELAQTLRERSVGWVVGTSLLFELVVLSLAAFVFCRRDY
jgi:ABC-type transport system involved in multi-copper enzyme maturation permease subunit